MHKFFILLDMKKVVVGISGGVDSAVTAHRLKAEGYEVIGVHLKITEDTVVPTSKLRLIRERIDIPVTVIDGSKIFREVVIEAFRNDHLAARTLSPCATCNPQLKWRLLFDFADAAHAAYTASGHYIQKVCVHGNWYLKQAVDPVKDQSYFLWGLGQKYLDRIITPLGNINKEEVKQYANKIGLGALTKQKESKGLCFSNGLTYSKLLQKYIPEATRITKGSAIDKNGNKIGTHQGYIYYTIGQKRGIDYFDSIKSNLCVIKINAEKNELVIGNDNDLWSGEFIIDDCHFIDEYKVLSSSQLELKVRGVGRNPGGYAQLEKMSRHKYRVLLNQPAWAMAPGQPVVFYENKLLLGGGIMVQ